MNSFYLLKQKIYSKHSLVRVFFLFITSLGLSACVTPGRLGIPEEQWNNYTAEERAKIKKGYYEILKDKLDKEKVTSDGTIVQVKLSGGKANMPPFASLFPYHPVDFEVTSGDCQTVTLKEEGGDKTVKMRACYFNKTLYLDPSHYEVSKRFGSIQLHYSPIWDRGFTYQNVSSSGYVHLTNVNVSVKRLNDEPNSE